MARVIKIDNALKKIFAKQASKKKSRELVAYFLIVCEGEKTEPNYFKYFPKRNGKIVYDLKFDGGGISTLKVVEKAIELRDSSKQKYDRVWAVFDRDSFKSNSFNSAILKAKANNIECAWSNQAFELWYLLHFHNRITSMHRDEYKKAIEKAINQKFKTNPFRYKKNSLDMYSTLKKHGNQEQAIKWARKLSNSFVGEKYSDFNPSTQVYKLVEELTGKSKKFTKEIIKKFNEGK
ncbi:MAG: RloB domain-containing protein [Bacteroidetes bacterium]|nr:MAG: RloB domain-containing protein [Bacteroidota bacterium]